MKNHWIEPERVLKKCGGRPSKVGVILGMDLKGYFEGVPSTFTCNVAARSLRRWLESVGVEVSISTSKRAINRLQEVGLIIVVVEGRHGNTNTLSFKPVVL